MDVDRAWSRCPERSFERIRRRAMHRWIVAAASSCETRAEIERRDQRRDMRRDATRCEPRSRACMSARRRRSASASDSFSTCSGWLENTVSVYGIATPWARGGGVRELLLCCWQCALVVVLVSLCCCCCGARLLVRHWDEQVRRVGEQTHRCVALLRTIPANTRR